MKKRLVTRALLACLSLPLGLCWTSGSAQAGRVDFETLPGGATPRQGMIVRNRYLASDGISFRLVGGKKARFVQTGLPGLGFTGWGDALDVAAPSEDIGSFFVVDAVRYGAKPKPLIASYSQPVARASGQILDLDRQEAWRITARDAANRVLERIRLDPSSPGAGNAKAISWSFAHASADIASIRIQYVGATRKNIGRGFDNFAWSTSPDVGNPPGGDDDPSDPPPPPPPPPPPVVAVPLPAMAWPAIGLIGVLAGVAARRRRQAL